MIDLFAVIFILSLLAGILVNFFGIPGNAVISINSIIYAIIDGFKEISLGFLVLIIAIALLIEFLEYLSIAFASYKFGASKKAVWGAILGGAAGALSGFFVTPVVGSIVGSISGVFVGAVLIELYTQKNIFVALKAGFGAFIGKLGGLTIKTIGSVVMATIVLFRILG